jgi:hypothetical protein
VGAVDHLRRRVGLAGVEAKVPGEAQRRPTMWLSERLEVNIPNIWWKGLLREPVRELTNVQWGHGGDEYGNCSVYFSCPLFRVVVFPGLCFQREVEVPDIGEHPFTDAMYYSKEDIAEWKTFNAAN